LNNLAPDERPELAAAALFDPSFRALLAARGGPRRSAVTVWMHSAPLADS